MKRNDFFSWLKEHDNKCSISQIRELGLVEKKMKDDYIFFEDEDGLPLIFGYYDDANAECKIVTYKPFIEPRIPKTDEVLNEFHKKLDKQDYERNINYNDILSGKKWYDKFYEKKGRKYKR